jgi:hypothetical protein
MTVAERRMAWVRDIEGDFEFTDLFARYTEIVGLKITAVVDTGSDQLAIHFDDGRILMIGDGGQNCCENRYMTCDDDLSGHEGGQLLHIDLCAGGEDVSDEDSYGRHETQFVKVQTTKGSITLCTHNEHNGYYGGFSISAQLHR